MWLIAAGLIPVAMAPATAMVGYVQIPKIALLRGTAIVLVALWCWEWALSASGEGTGSQASLGQRLKAARPKSAAQWVLLAAGLFFGVNVLSTALSPVWRVSLWGYEPGWDTYALYNVASYFVLFLAVATHLRRPAQLRRLLWVITAATLVVSVYAISQHYGFDPMLPAEQSDNRAQSTSGNPVFAGAYLLLAIPLTLAMVISTRTATRWPVHILAASVVVTIEFLAMAFTLSRGPWVGLILALVVFLALAQVILGIRWLARAAAVVVISAAVTVLVVVATQGNVEPQETVGARAISTIGDVQSGNLSGRGVIWKTTAKVILTHPWLDSSQFPDLPSLSLPWLRPLVGYGPEMFTNAYASENEPQLDSGLVDHAHNFFLQETVELGALGLVAFLGLLAALAAAAVALLRAARREAYAPAISLPLLGIVSALAGRVLEQMVGKAQVMDLTVFWLLAGVLVAFPTVAAKVQSTTIKTQPVGSPDPEQSKQKAGSRRVAEAVVMTALLAIALWQTNGRYVYAASVSAPSTTIFQTGDYPQALRLLDRSINLAPDSERHLLRKAAALDLLGFDVEAHQTVQRAIKRNPLSQRAWIEAAEYATKQARTDDTWRETAINDLKVAAALLPGYYVLHNNLAATYIEFQQPKDALPELQRSLVITGTSPPAAADTLFIAGIAYINLNMLDQATKMLEVSLQVDPGHRNAAEARRLLAGIAQKKSSGQAK